MKADIVIVGAGPAGLSAAITAARLSASVLVVDENDRLGGRVLSHSVDVKKSSPWFAQSKRIKALNDGLNKHSKNITFLRGCTVWGKGIHGSLLLSSEDKSIPPEITGGAYILANGALESIVPFPGWTLPGIYSLGGLNSLIRKNIIPGKKFVLAGSGPLLFALIDSLLERKCEVEALIQPIGLKQIICAAPGLSTGLDREKAGILYRSLKGVFKNKIRHFNSHIVCEAQGRDELTNLKICSIDKRWKVLPATEKNIEADVLGISYGLRPSVDLSHMLGCKIFFDPTLGYWRTLHDTLLESSLENVYVAGDNSQIRGYTAAEKQGKLAALSACAALGITSVVEMESQIRKLQKYLHKNAIFGKTLDNLSQPGPDIWDVVTDDCVICRCESISLAEIRKASEAGLGGIHDLKRRTRVGMGYCQGRYCGQIINEILWHFTGHKGKREMFTPRIPMRPVSFETISGSDA